MATISVTTEPGSEPINKDQVKFHLGIDGTQSDDAINVMIAAARQHVERITNRRLIEQTLAIYFDTFPSGVTIKLPVAPVSAIVSVQYYDVDGSLQTFASTKYFTDLVSEPGRIVLDPDEVWPDIETGRPNAVVINVTAGYGDGGSDVPEGIINAMLMMIEKVYDRPDGNYLTALERVETNQLSPYLLRGFR